MIKKVTALILRNNGAQHEILTFLHPSAGRQLPAGTVEEHETPEEAVIREVKEETGLRNVEIVKKTGEVLQYTTGQEYILVKPARFHGWPAPAAKRVGPLLTRGIRVQVTERKGGFAHVIYEEMDLNQNPPKLLWDSKGWLPPEFLTREIQRSFFILNVHETTPNTWSQLADMGYTYQLEWLPVNPKPELIGEQGGWLDFLE